METQTAPLAATLANLIKSRRVDEAVALCERHASEPFIGAYYSFWLQRLTAGQHAAAGVEADAPAAEPRPSKAARWPLIDDVAEAFASHPYQVTDEPLPAPDALEAAKKVVVDASPFKSEIYQPTAKMPLDAQVRGLRRVGELLSDANLRATKGRFEILKAMIRERGVKRIFVIGNGPSLKKTDLALLADEVTIGFNGIFLHDSFTPTIHVVEDHLVAEDRMAEIHAYRCPIKIFPSYLGYCIEPQANTIFLNHRSRISYPVDTDFSDDAGSITYTGGTVTYTGLQIAASLGVDEVILLGVDASYQVHNVDRSETYGTGVLTSKEDDTNHFDPRYFGKGFRWHDPNVHTMLQAYRKAREHGRDHGIDFVNATLGGQLEVFPRVDFHGLFPRSRVYPRVAVLDFTPLTRVCATGVVKKNLLQGWARSSLLHVFAEEKARLVAFQAIEHDLYAAGSEDNSVWPALRSLIEYDPEVLYLRPTADRVPMTVLQVVAAAVLGKPWVVHYMDDWLARTRATERPTLAQAQEDVLRYLVDGARHVLSISDKMSSHLVSRFSVPAARVDAIHNFMSSAAAPRAVRSGDERLIRYFGGLEADMGLATLVEVAGQVEAWNAEASGERLRFEIYASTVAIDKKGHLFSAFPATRLLPLIDDDDGYAKALSMADLNLVCYNFDEASVRYVRYSMANKLAELLACGVPFLAIGHAEIGTIELLRRTGYPLLLTEPDFLVAPMLRRALALDAEVGDAYRAATALLKTEFSEDNNRCRFHAILRAAGNARTPAPQRAAPVLALATLVEAGTAAGRLNNSRDIDVLLRLPLIAPSIVAAALQRVRSHGREWSIRDEAAALGKLLKTADALVKAEPALQARALAALICGLGLDRYKAINDLVRAWVLQQYRPAA